MKNPDAVSALAALAQENRLDVYRLLVRAGPEGMPAGSVASALKLAPNTLTFHFDRLRDAGLVTVQREGRSMIYAAQFEVMNELLGFLTENCCQAIENVRRLFASPLAQPHEGCFIMKRLHVHVSVDSINNAIAFYSALFAAKPSVIKDDYAKWMLDDPHVNFAISSRGHNPGLDRYSSRKRE